MRGSTLNLDGKPATHSREAEIAARLKARLDEGHYEDRADRDLRYLLAQLQQARQEIERLNSPVLQSEWQKQEAALQQARQERESALVELEAERFRSKELQASIDGCAQRVLTLAAALQQAREALAVYGQHQAECAAVYPTYHAGSPCTCGLDAALKAGR